MAIRQRKDRGGKWQVYWKNPYTQKQESAMFATEKEARKADDLVSYKLKWEPEAFRPIEEEEPEKRPFTVQEVFEKYLNAKRFANEYVYRSQFKKILAVIGKRVMADITTADLTDMMCSIAVGVSDRTVYNKMTFVSAVFNWAYKCGYISQVPRFPDRPKFKRRELIPPTIAQLETMLENAPPHMQRVIVIGSQLGCRVGPSELLSIKWSDFDFARRVLMLRAACKNRREPVREIPIKESLITLLTKWHDDDAKLGIPWVVHYSGKHIRNCWGSWNGILKRSGFEPGQFRPYDLRHAFATEAISAGADMGTVSRLMGHAQVTTTLMHYQHVMDGQKRAAVEAVPDLSCMPKRMPKEKRKKNSNKNKALSEVR